MKDIQELKQERDELRKQLFTVENTLSKQIRAESLPAFKEVYIGKFFKLQNRYSSGKAWWRYVLVTEIKDSDIYEIANGELSAHCICKYFETTPDGEVTMHHNYRTYVHSLEKKISEKEFTEAYNKMIGKLNTFF